MSYHNCGQSLCVTPHSITDYHKADCLCDLCHPEHDWQEWRVYPECEGCVLALFEWLPENVDEPMCECGSFRVYIGWIDNPQCLRCYSADLDSIHESLKEAL
jgi:hypothetical protein